MADKKEDLKDHSVTATEMAAMRGTKAGKLAAADAATADRLAVETADEKAEEDTSNYARLARSGYVLNEDESDGRRWVGLPVSQVPEEQAKEHKVRITAIAEVRPWTGLTVKPKNGEPFAVPEVPKDETPAFWLGLIIPGTKTNFIEA